MTDALPHYNGAKYYVDLALGFAKKWATKTLLVVLFIVATTDVEEGPDGFKQTLQTVSDAGLKALGVERYEPITTPPPLPLLSHPDPGNVFARPSYYALPPDVHIGPWREPTTPTGEAQPADATDTPGVDDSKAVADTGPDSESEYFFDDPAVKYEQWYRAERQREIARQRAFNRYYEEYNRRAAMQRFYLDQRRKTKPDFQANSWVR